MPAVLASRGFLGLYSAVAAAALLEGCTGDEDSRRRDGFVRLGVMTVRGPAGDIEDTETEPNISKSRLKHYTVGRPVVH